MSARAQFEHMMFRAGSLPEGILSHEPAPDAPIPTAVEYTNARGGHETYRQELDEQGRLLTVTLDGRGTGPYLERTWTGEDTYVDQLANGVVNGSTHSVVDAGPGRRVVTQANGKMTTLIELGECEGITQFIAQDNPDNRGFGPSVVHLASVTEDGRVLDEEEWPYHGYYGDPLWPNSTRIWEHEDGDLASIITRVGGRREMGAVMFTERFSRAKDGKLKVIGEYPDGMTGWEQTREYDSDGRVEVIRDRVYVPDSAMRDVALELSYD